MIDVLPLVVIALAVALIPAWSGQYRRFDVRAWFVYNLLVGCCFVGLLAAAITLQRVL